MAGDAAQLAADLASDAAQLTAGLASDAAQFASECFDRVPGDSLEWLSDGTAVVHVLNSKHWKTMPPTLSWVSGAERLVCGAAPAVAEISFLSQLSSRAAAAPRLGSH